ncbi:nucleoside hydrolase [Bosea sp. (in: a-proteobacteria)]|uniref:nucleoside hydrolase n=1 Tax=Bosea sp. (in: a-proteobacteria) TaxID=1871050 RepID=UPI002B485F84|nr:nucleoside hydrolase [Bosea sp. (in: a-proteobacteria)]WRH59396.1 MAG: nucleoside hydrolase [Bosea sp. (in: a-proteobacteria)]
MREAILIDTDPGQDDAVALLLAFASRDRLDLRAITTVAGNVPVAQTTANALRIRDLAGAAAAAVPVHAGAEGPLLFPLETAEFVCGPDGLAGADLPPPASTVTAGHAVEAIIALCRAAPDDGITLCPLGPLTNLALAIRLAPDILPRIRRIVLMGGALGLGNMTPAAEFNVHVDPHAAAIVFGCGRPIVMIGLGVTLQAIASHEQVARIGALGTATGRAVHGMLTRQRPGGLGTAGHPMHDPCVIAFLLWPELFAGRDCLVEIETGAGSLRGRTTIDWNGRLKHQPNAHVVATVEATELFERMIERLATLP